MKYPKRLIEVDLPIRRISAHARREKSIRRGHISTLHIWWARRPLAACRAVTCAALWLDPVDQLCPQEFRDRATLLISAFAEKAAGNSKICSDESYSRWQKITKGKVKLDAANPQHWNILRFALLDFIADFANWDNSTQVNYLETSRALTQASHEALGGQPGTRPLIADPFAGGGSIPMEALRVGADAFASDVNPVAVILNKVLLEYLPRYGKQLEEEVSKCGNWVKTEVENDLKRFYPEDSEGSIPFAYLWARTIFCEGPSCGTEVPLIRSLYLVKKKKRSLALQLVPNPEENRIDFKIIEKQGNHWIDTNNPTMAINNPNFEGTVKRGSATCPCCGFTTPVSSVRAQLSKRHGGALDARLFCVVSTQKNKKGRFYRLPTSRDLLVIENALSELLSRENKHMGVLSLVPDEIISLNEIRRISVPLYGMKSWGDLFNVRQALTLSTLCQAIGKVDEKLEGYEPLFREAVKTCLALAVDRCANQFSSLSKWNSGRELVDGLFARQAIPMLWDFGEMNLLAGTDGYWLGAISWITDIFKKNQSLSVGQVELASATTHPLPDDSVDAYITDPPYYDAVPYSYLSDFFYVWLKRSLSGAKTKLLARTLVEKTREIVVDRPHELSNSSKDIFFYEQELTKAFTDGCRILRPNGIGTIVFASKTTASWEAILKAVIDAGWIITGSWPIDTEMENRVSAQSQARLASSVHLVCRPRENIDGSLRESVGDWRDVLQELPSCIHSWMPRLSSEGVVGADAIFACLGPALEIFSRYSSVEKASGEEVTLQAYLEYVWGAVSKEALSMIFEGVDTTGFEEDARLTAMWLWTLSASNRKMDDETDDVIKSVGYTLEFDAARKIAQGLGAHLEQLTNLVEIKKGEARLLPVIERGSILFGKENSNTFSTRKAKKKDKQLDIFAVFKEEDSSNRLQDNDLGVPKIGRTVLDQVHQSMILFAAGRSEALKRFLVEEGVGNDQRYWKLAQALSALYPMGTDEKRWVDGVLARKKGLGF